MGGVLRGAAPLFATTWAGRVGVSELPPPPASGQPGIPPWDQWARSVRVDLAALRQYGQAVYAASDEYLASLTDGDLTRVIDLSFAGLGQQTLAWVLAAGVVGHTWSHLGEISTLKGLQPADETMGGRRAARCRRLARPGRGGAQLRRRQPMTRVA
ncbi:MAG: DinB family protein [Chloroflexi bacterium]|nr:DinB family protein [Chloroflexota bacterium]